MIELHIPVEIPSQNQTGKGRTWRVRAAGVKRLRVLWCCWGRVVMGEAKVPKATGRRSLHIVAYRKQRCADIGNLIGGAKACIDGLVDAGLLVDDRDTKACITYEQHSAGKSPTKKPHTILRIADIQEPSP